MLTVGRDSGVATITFNRPDKRNALTPAMLDEIAMLLHEIGRRPEDRVVVLTGAGTAFCAGADLSSVPAGSDGSLVLGHVRQLNDALLALHRLPQPTIAKVNGDAAGAGTNIALGCDLIVAAEEARFIQIFSRRGLAIESGGSWLLPRLIGLHQAKELAFFGEALTGREAANLRLINKAVPAEELDANVCDWARRLADGPALALSLTKRLLNQSIEGSMEGALENEGRCSYIAASDDDCAEGVRAFLERRAPAFGRRA